MFLVAEAERADRAFDLYPSEVASVVDEHFDVIAARTGDPDQITIDDLHHTIDDESLPDQVRDAAYRLASDAALFTDMDVTNQTDLSNEPLGVGFAWDKSDGIIGRDDIDQYPDTEYRRRILAAWHPLVETANQGYDLGRADSHAGQQDVIAFIGDEDIPTYARLAVFDTYAERHQLTLEQREVLESEVAWDGTNYGGGNTRLGATGSPALASHPVQPRPEPTPVGGPGAVAVPGPALSPRSSPS